MRKIRRSEERGETRLDWLDGKHSFSFSSYYDPEWTHWGPLRVINEDVIAPNGGFPTHPHADMEIVTIVMSGRLEHKDSMGNGSIIDEGQVQYMSAGKGVYHSEFNSSSDDPVHLFQIWIEPDQRSYEPRYDEKMLSREKGEGWKTILSTDEGTSAIHIRQDLQLEAGVFGEGEVTKLPLNKNKGWLQVARGKVEIDGERLSAGDALAIENENSLDCEILEDAELFLFDMA